MKKVLLLFLFISLVVPTAAFARIGVGVATGKIQVHDKLKPGLIYNLPPLTVINTGDVPSDYAVSLTYFEKQKQMKPSDSWFIFSPQMFHLDPGNVQVVNIKLNLPLAVTPGDYFGFLEAHPIQKATAGKTTVGIAAAAKLYFTVVPANIFQALYYKIVSFWNVYAPWPQWTVILVLIVGAFLLARKYLNIQIGVKKHRGTTVKEDGTKELLHKPKKMSKDE